MAFSQRLMQSAAACRGASGGAARQSGGRRRARAPGRRHAARNARRRQAVSPFSGAGECGPVRRGGRRPPWRRPPPSNACIATRLSTTILPAMDNDDLRRGRPTVHKAFDEWTAILAGDALLTLAFEILSGPAAHADPAVRAELVAGLARASGGAGMAGGQCLDLEAEKLGSPAQPTASHVQRLQAMKTGALLRFSCEAGAILGRRRRRAAPRTRALRRLHRARVPDRRRPARPRRRRRRHGQGRRQRRRQGDTACRKRCSHAPRRGWPRSRRRPLPRLHRSGPTADTLREAASFVVRRER